MWETHMCVHTHIHTGLLFTHEKEGILSFVTTWMDLEGSVLSEMSEGERQILYDIT